MRHVKTAGVVVAIVVVGLLFAVDVIADGDESSAEQIAQTREVLEQWVENQRIISQEKRDLKLAKEMLNERIELIESEIASLQKKIGEAEESIAEADKKRAEMVEENEHLKQASSSLTGTLVGLEDRTKDLLKRLPDPIRDHVKPLSQRIPNDSKDTKLSVSERFQNVVGILNAVDKFNREISVTSEVRTLSGGKSVEVTSMYIGIGQGFYASANGDIAGVGTATDTDWVWSEKNEAAKEISDAIAILQNEKVATYVKLPVEIK